MGAFRKLPLAHLIEQSVRKNSPDWRTVLGLALGGASVVGVEAQPTNIDIRSGADLVTNGSIHNINNVQTGNVAVNVFNQFYLAQPDTANLNFQANKLVNIVRDKVEVHGVLNSYKNGQLGGDVVFASSQGFLVGPSGIVNVGKLTIDTPDASTLDAWQSLSPEALDAALSERSYAVSSNGLVKIQGFVNTANGVDVRANSIVIDENAVVLAGDVTGSAQRVATIYSAAVNLGGVTDTAANALRANESGDIILTAVAEGEADLWNPLSAIGDESAGGVAEVSAYVEIRGALYAENVTATAQAVATAEYEYTAATDFENIANGGSTSGLWASTSLWNSGIPLNNAEADATAHVTIFSGAEIHADGDVTLAAETFAEVGTSGLGEQKTGRVTQEGAEETIFLGAPLVYGSVRTDNKVEIEAGAVVNAAGDLILEAHNEAALGLQAMTAPPTENAVAGDPFAIAVGHSDLNTKAVIHTDANITAANVAVVAESISSFDVSASGDAALALGIFNTNVVAEMGANLGTAADRVGDVTVLAVNRIDKQQVSSKAAPPEGDNPYTVSTISVGFVTQMPDVATQITELVDSLIGEGTEADAAGDMARGSSENGTSETGTPTTASSNVTWETGVAMTINTGNHNTEAFIGNTVIGGAAPKIYSDGQVAVLAQTDTRLYRTLSEAEAKPEAAELNEDGTQPTQQGSTISVAVATSIAVQDSLAVAQVGEGVYINADNVAVVAQQTNTFNNPWTEWDNMLNVLEGLVSAADDIAESVTSFANATASSKQQGAQQGQNSSGKAFGGAFNVQVVDHDTKAWVGDGAHIVANGSDDAAREITHDLTVRHLDGDSLSADYDSDNEAFGMQWFASSAVKVAAYNKINALHLNGNMGAKLIKPTSTNGAAIGGTVAYVDWKSDAVAGVGEARIESANGGLDIEAINNDMQVLVTPSAGMGKGVGFSGALAILNVNNFTSASLSNQAFVDADSVVIGAAQLISHWAASGAFSMTDKTAIGIGAAVVISNGDTEAFVGDNSAEAAKFVPANSSVQHPAPTPAPIPGVLIETPAILTRELQVTAATSGMTGAIGVAGTVAKSPSQPQAPGAGGAPAQGGTSAANGAGNKPSLWEKFKGVIADPEGSLLSAFNNATKDDSADGNNQSGGTGGTGGTGNSNGSSTTSIASVSGDAKSTPTSSGGSTPPASGGAQPPAGQSTDSPQSAGLAASGAFTVMVADVNVDARIDGATIESRSTSEAVDVSVEALSKTVQVSAAGGAALTMNSQPSPNGSTALAGAIAYQISNNNTSAIINNTDITRAGNVAVDALSSGERITIGIGAGVNTTPSAGSGNNISAAISVSAAQVFDVTSAAITGGSISALESENTDLDVTAYNSTDIGVGGGAIYAGGKTGLGLSITFASIGNQGAQDAISAVISGANISNFDSIGVNAFNASRIVLASAGMGIQASGEGQAVSLGGSFGVGDISTRTRALINGGAVIVGGDVAVNAVGTKDQDLETRINDRVDTALNGSINASQAAKDAIAAAEAATAAAELANAAEAEAIAAKKLADANPNNSALQTAYLDKLALANAAAQAAIDAETLADQKAADSASYDFSGRAAYGKTGTHTSEDGGERATYSAEGERIIVAVGQVNVAMGATGVAAGIAYGHADIHTVREARIDHATITQAGDVEVNARNEALIYNMVVGVAVSSGNFSGVGSVGVSRINNKVIAEIGQWDTNNVVTDIVAQGLSLDADNRAQIIAATGGVAITAGTGAAGGLAVSVNLVGDRGGENGQITRARVGNANVSVNDLSVHAQSGDDNERNQIIGNAIGVGIATQGAAFSGAITVNNIDQTVDAGVKNIGGAGVDGGDLNISAQDNTYSVGTAWSVAGAGGGPAVGVAVVTNRVDAHVTAELLGNGGANTATQFDVENASITAKRDLELLTIDAGVAISQTAAVAPSVGTALTSGTVLARIADNAHLHAQNNIKVAAESDTLSHAASGAIGVGIKGGAGALAVSTVIDDSNTFAYIDNSNVQALGLGANTSVNSGVLNGQANLADLENSDEQAADRRSLESNFTHNALQEGTESVSGLAVNATSYNRMLAVEIAGSGGLFAGVAVNAATHAFNGETSAYISNSIINEGIDPTSDTGADVLVRSGAHNAALGITAGIAVAGGGGAVAGLVLNLEDHNNSAKILNSTVKANQLSIDAATTNTMQGVAVGVGGGGFGGAASVVTNKLGGDTLAQLSGNTVTANSINVVAKNAQETNAATGSMGIGGGAGIGMGLIVNLVSGDTQAIVGKNPTKAGETNYGLTTLNANHVNVNAVRAQNIQGYAFGAGLSTGGAGVAGMINVSDTTGETRAGVYNAKILGVSGVSNSSAANVQITATEYFTAKHMAGALGAGAVGVGAAFNVILNSTQTIAELVNSNTRATQLGLKALSENDSQSTSVAGGAGAFGGALSLGYIRQGTGSGSLGTQNDNGNDQGGAEDFNASQNAVNGILASNGDALDNNHVLTDAERAALKTASAGSLDVEAGETTQNVNAIEGQALTGAKGKVIAARISGGSVDTDSATVESIGESHNRVLSGGVAVGVVAASGGLGIIRNYNQNLALVDGVVNAESLTVNALEGNGAGHAAEVESFSGSAGGIAISVAVSDARVENNVKAKVTQAQGNGSGNLVVNAHDSTSVKVGGDENIPTNISVALAAVSVSHATAEKNSKVAIELGGTDKNIKGYKKLDANALVSGMVRSTAFTASAAYFGNLQGVWTIAKDKSSSYIGIGGNYQIDELTLDSKAQAEVSTRSYGIAVAAGVAVGASIAESTANTTSTINVANGTNFAESGFVNIYSANAQNGNLHNADAQAFAASGGLLAGAAGAAANAVNTSKTRVIIGDNVTTPEISFIVRADSDVSQYSEADGIAAGLLGVGSINASAKSDVDTTISVGKNLKQAVGAQSMAQLGFAAVTDSKDSAHADAAAGGAITGSASKGETDTDGESRITFAGWDAAATAIDAYVINVLASHTAFFSASADSINASALGLSGAITDSDINVGSYVDFGSNLKLSAGRIVVNALTDVKSREEGSNNVAANAGSGGFLNGTAATSHTTVHQDASIKLGNNVQLSLNDLSDLNVVDHLLRLDAKSISTIFSEARMTAGGAFQGGGSVSAVDVTSTNTVQLGDNVKLQSEIGDIELGTHSIGGAWASANVSLYGAAGLAVGDARSTVTSNNNLTLGNGVQIDANGSVNLYAGRSASHLSDNNLSARATSDVYNGTVIPLESDPRVHASTVANNNITIGNNVRVTTVRNIWLQAVEGIMHAVGDGRGRDLYGGIFSSERRVSHSHENADSVITFAGAAHFEAGIRHEQLVTINANGDVVLGANTIADIDTEEGYSSKAELVDQRNALAAEKQSLLAEVAANTIPETTVPLLYESDVYAAEDYYAEDVLDEQGAIIHAAGELIAGSTPIHLAGSQVLDAAGQPVFSTIEGYTPPTPLRVGEITELLNELNEIINRLSDTPNDAIYIANINAAAGDINLTAKNIVTGAANVRMVANGGPKIEVVNNSDYSLILEDFFIINPDGGRIVVTGGVEGSIDEITRLIRTTNNTDRTPLISVDHNAEVDRADVMVRGQMQNLGGLIDMDIAKGNMLQTGSISARQMSINVPNGIFVLQNNAYQAFGFDPKSLRNYQTTNGWLGDLNNAESIVDLWISAKYQSDIARLGIEGFNTWLYSADYKSYSEGSYAYLRLFKNWGFQYDCTANCVSFEMKKDDAGRGGKYWSFDKVVDKTNVLTRTATYQQAKNSVSRTPSVNAEAIFINAREVDINGTIKAGAVNNWSIQVNSSFDNAIAQHIRDAGLRAGDQVSIKLNDGGLGSHLSIIDPNTSDAITYTGIGLIYDVATNKLLLDDVRANSNGYVSITGKMLSTGPEGRILVDNGFGDILVNNRSNTELVLNNLSVGGASAGIVRIEDKNYNNIVDWYVQAPGEKIKHYQTQRGQEWQNQVGRDVGEVYSNGTASFNYATKAGQLYTWTDSTNVSRTTPNWEPSPYWGEWGGFGDWKYTNQNDKWQRAANGQIVQCGVATIACGNTYMTTQLSAGYGGYEYDGRYFTYKDYYPTEALSPDVGGNIEAWRLYAFTDLTLNAKTYVKADHAIKIEFIGSSEGGVKVDSVAGIDVQGVINNQNGKTTLTTTNGDIKVGSNALINSKHVELNARGSIASDAQALRVVTANISANAGGAINLDLSKQSSDVIKARFAAGSNLNVISNASLEALGTGVQISGTHVNIVSGGSIGKQSDVYTIDVDGNINLLAADDIYIEQADGDLYVGSIQSTSGDVSITINNGDLRNAYGLEGYSEEQKAYLSSLWDKLGLQDVNAGEIAVTAFENNINSNLLQLWQVRDQLANTELSDDDRSSLEAREVELENFFASLTVENENGIIMLQDDLSQADRFESIAYTQYNNYWNAKKALDNTQAKIAHADRNIAHVSDLLAAEQALAIAQFEAEFADVPVEDRPNRTATAMEQQYIAMIGERQAERDGLVAQAIQLDSEIDGANSWFAAQVDADMLASNPTDANQYSLNWLSYSADSTVSEKLTGGAHWSDSALEIVISDAALKPTTHGFITERGANISGANVSLNIAGSLGLDLPSETITIDKSAPNLSDEQKAMLYNAGAGDVNLTDQTSQLLVDVRRQNPVKINATGNVSIFTEDHIYAESDRAMSLLQINAGGDVRLAAAGQISSNSGNGVTITADNLNIATSTNGIGSAANPISIHLDGVLRNVSSAGAVYIDSRGGDLTLGSVGAAGLLSLKANGNIVNWSESGTGYHISANGAVIIANDGTQSFDLGADDRALRMNLRGGELVLEGDNAWVDIDQSGSWVVDRITMDGDLHLSSNGNINGKEIADLEEALADPTLLPTVNAHIDVAGKTYLSAATGIGNPLVVDTPWMSIASDAGDINIVALSDVNYLSLDAQDGDGFVWVNGALFAQNLNFTNGSVAARGRLEIEEATVNNAEFISGAAMVLHDIDATGTLDIDSAAHLDITNILASQATIISAGAMTMADAEIDDALINSGDSLLLTKGVFATSGTLSSVKDMEIIEGQFGSGILSSDESILIHRASFNNALVSANNNLEVHYARLKSGVLSAKNNLVLDQLDMLASGPITLQANTITADIDGGYAARSRDNFAGHNTMPLSLTVTGWAGGQASTAVVNVTNMPQLTVEQLLVNSGSLYAPEQISLVKGYTPSRFVFTTDNIHIDLDNNNRGAKPVDAQIVTPYGNYWFNLNGSDLSTDAQVTRFDPTSIKVIYVGRDGQVISGGAYMGLSVESRQANISQVANAGPRMRRPSWFTQVLSFTRVGRGVDGDGDQSEATQPDALREQHDYSVVIEL